MNPKITIALAAYNADKYIKETIYSLINQSLKNIEILIIDDASSDNTSKIVSKFASCDKRIKVITLVENKGLANARNLSLANAAGEYICFVDGDDIFHHRLFEEAYELAVKESSDLVLWDFKPFTNTNDLSKLDVDKSILKKDDAFDIDLLIKRPAFTHTKLIKVSAAKKLKVIFPIGLIKQDIPVHWLLILKIKNISILPKIYTYYRQHDNATSYKSDKRVLDIEKIMRIVRDLLLENNLWKNYSDLFLESQLNLLVGMYDVIDTKYKNDAIELIKKNLHNDQINYIYSQKSLRWRSRAFLKYLLGSKLSLLKYRIWHLFRNIYRKIKS